MVSKFVDNVGKSMMPIIDLLFLVGIPVEVSFAADEDFIVVVLVDQIANCLFVEKLLNALMDEEVEIINSVSNVAMHRNPVAKELGG